LKQPVKYLDEGDDHDPADIQARLSHQVLSLLFLFL
jgi:hypothetical protein